MVQFNAAKIKNHIPNLDASDASQDNVLRQYWSNAKHFYDNKAAIHTTSPTEFYDADAYDLWEKRAAAEWIYWNSPTHPMDGLKHIDSEIMTHLRAKFHKKTDTTSANQVGKTNSRVRGTEGL